MVSEAVPNGARRTKTKVVPLQLLIHFYIKGTGTSFVTNRFRRNPTRPQVSLEPVCKETGLIAYGVLVGLARGQRVIIMRHLSFR